MQRLPVHPAAGPPRLRLVPARRARVEELRLAVASGQYEVDPDAVAASLLRRVPWHDLV